MDVTEVMDQLAAAGSEQTRKTYRRHGVGEPLFGVSYAELGRLQKQIRTDHPLALALWATGNHDARILATKIADPAALTVKQADAMVRDCDNAAVAEALAALVGRSPIGPGRAAAWRDRRGEWVASAGWSATAHLMLDPVIVPDDERRRLLDQIVAEIHGRPNRVRYEMNSVVIAIGVWSGPELRDAALAAALAIGTVEVDHGPTACTTPDAAGYIAKSVARRAARAG